MSADGFSFRLIFLTDDPVAAPVRPSAEIDALLNDALHPSSVPLARVPLARVRCGRRPDPGRGVELTAFYEAAAVPPAGKERAKSASRQTTLN